jgi:hypothetical protein
VSDAGVTIDLAAFARRMFDAVTPDESERHTLAVCRSALIRVGYPAANLDFRWFRRQPHEVRGATLADVAWIAVDLELADLRETIFHEAGHLLVAPGGSAEAEEQATRFEQRMMHAMGWDAR